MTQGKFITLEGGEGGGKTTNLEFIGHWLAERPLRWMATREPGGTPLGESIRQLLLESESMTAMAELLLIFAARAEHVHRVIAPALNEGIWVVCDRFTDASYAYQGGGRGIDQALIATLESWVHPTIQPDLTILFDTSVEIGLSLAKRRGNPDRFESESPAFFSRIRLAYLSMAEKHSERMKVIDASQPLPQVQREIGVLLQSLLQDDS